MNQTIENILTKQSLSKVDLQVLENYEPNDNQNRLYLFLTQYP